MKYTRLQSKSFYVFLAAILLCNPLAYGRDGKILRSSVSWKGSSVMNIEDQDFTIKGKVDLPGGSTQVRAHKRDVVVTLDDDPLVNGSHAKPSYLNLHADEGRKIVFDVSDEKLTFAGTANIPLVIIVSGHGLVEFNVGGGKRVEFSTGVWTLVLMDDPRNEQVPTLKFNRIDSKLSSANKDVEIILGKHALMSYIANGNDDLKQRGAIVFDASTDFTTTDTNGNVESARGRMVLEIKNNAGVVVAGHHVKGKSAHKIEVKDIDFTTAALEQAIFSVVNDAGPNNSAGLLVKNENDTWSELLADPFLTLGARLDLVDFKGSFNGRRYGFILGANGELHVGSNAYFDYVGLRLNRAPQVNEIPGFENVAVRRLVKERNPSAFIVDGNHNPAAKPARIVMGEASGIFFRSGVDDDGDVNEDTAGLFTVRPENRTPGVGQLVFDVEGWLDVVGSNSSSEQLSKIELLSLQVSSTGGELFVGGSQTIFPKRTFALNPTRQNAADTLRYNTAYFLINNRMNIIDASLSHTDENHAVFPENDLRSEPTYIGGETYKLLNDSKEQETDPDAPRPTIAFYDARFNVHTDVAITGVDLRVPNGCTDIGDNTSRLVAYSNGITVDNGTGRQIILGTTVGATAIDECVTISEDAHLDVIPDNACEVINRSRKHKPKPKPAPKPVEAPTPQKLEFGSNILRLQTAVNDDSITQGLPDSPAEVRCPLEGHTIYLGHSSNISIGLHQEFPVMLPFPTRSELLIAGNFFNIESRGGPLRSPSTTNVTGRGGVFVDENGFFGIIPNASAHIGTMVTLSSNGEVNLPEGQVTFDPGLGIAVWRLDLSNPTERIIVSQNENLSEFVLNWAAIIFDPDFCPIQSDVSCICPVVDASNIDAIPTIQGTVQQLQIQGSRLGNPAHIRIDGGRVEELVFTPGDTAGEIPAAVVVLSNNGFIGVNSSGTTSESANAATSFSVSGITIVADGSGQVNLNADMTISGCCAFLRGPNFTSSDVLEFIADEPRQLVVTSTGTFDLQSFIEGDNIRVSGEITVVFEPGSKLLLNGATLHITENSSVTLPTASAAQTTFNALPLGGHDETLDPLTPTPSGDTHNQFAPLTGHGAGLRNTDSFRVGFIGTGTLSLEGSARMVVERDAYLGVETLRDEFREITVTDFVIELHDSAQFSLGDGTLPDGGVLQVGNTQDRVGHTVSFTLRIDGPEAIFRMHEQAFLGLNAGIVDKRNDQPNQWLIDVLYNATASTITLDMREGLFEAAQIFDGDSTNAQLIAIGQENASDTSGFSLLFDNPITGTLVAINGGSNLVHLVRGEGSYHPIVRSDDDFVVIGQDADGNDIIHPNLRVGILASGPLLLNESLVNVSGQVLFEAIKAGDATDGTSLRSDGKGVAGLSVDDVNPLNNTLRVGYVDRGFIGRSDVTEINGQGSTEDKIQAAAQRGAVFIGVNQTANPPAPLTTVGLIA